MMAVSAYIGLPGSGKSYEVVKSVILPALAKGRRIVTNIYGIHDALCRDFVVSYADKYPCENGLGDIIHVTNEDVNKPGFFPDYDDTDKFCKKGDLILLDEVHRFFGTRLSKEQENFVAEHRHYADEQTGLTCDLIIVTQSLDTLPRFVRSRIDTTFRMKKLNHVGLNRRYRIDVYSSGKLIKANLIRSYQEKYWSAIFSLYDSNTVKNATELQTDDRTNMLRGKKYIICMVLFPVLLIFIVFRLYHFFHPLPDSPGAAVSAPSSQASFSDVSVSSSAAAVPQSSSQWCIAGTLFLNGHNYVLLTDPQHHLRRVSRKYFDGEGTQISGVFEGQEINSWSCSHLSAVAPVPALSSVSAMTGGQ